MIQFSPEAQEGLFNVAPLISSGNRNMRWMMRDDGTPLSVLILNPGDQAFLEVRGRMGESLYPGDHLCYDERTKSLRKYDMPIPLGPDVATALNHQVFVGDSIVIAVRITQMVYVVDFVQDRMYNMNVPHTPSLPVLIELRNIISCEISMSQPEIEPMYRGGYPDLRLNRPSPTRIHVRMLEAPAQLHPEFVIAGIKIVNHTDIQIWVSPRDQFEHPAGIIRDMHFQTVSGESDINIEMMYLSDINHTPISVNVLLVI